LAVYKPLGMTAYGRRKQVEQRHRFSSQIATVSEATLRADATRTSRWLFVPVIVAIAMLLLIVILHLAGGGLTHH
jgi:hypothetical protein